ncbi:MAG: nucleotidyltransferase family protein, partial [Lactimicrobium massiliense]
MLDTVMNLFLDAYAHALHHERVIWTQDISEAEWKALFQMAQEQNVLPMIYESVFQCPGISVVPGEMLQQLRSQVVRDVSIQTIKTAEFLKLYAFLSDRGLHPIVMKGIVCRRLYPL